MERSSSAEIKTPLTEVSDDSFLVEDRHSLNDILRFIIIQGHLTRWDLEELVSYLDDEDFIK